MKSLYHLASILLITIVLICGVSCIKGGRCEGALNVNQSEIVVTFKDQATGKYLYSEVNPLYNKDSLEVFDPSGNALVILRVLRVNPGTLSKYWDLSFGNLYNQTTDANSFNAEICKGYILKYKYNVIDTIKVCFKAKNTKCGSKFETLKVYHRGATIRMGTNTTGMQVTVIKN